MLNLWASALEIRARAVASWVASLLYKQDTGETWKPLVFLAFSVESLPYKSAGQGLFRATVFFICCTLIRASFLWLWAGWRKGALNLLISVTRNLASAAKVMGVEKCWRPAPPWEYDKLWDLGEENVLFSWSQLPGVELQSCWTEAEEVVGCCSRVRLLLVLPSFRFSWINIFFICSMPLGQFPESLNGCLFKKIISPIWVFYLGVYLQNSWHLEMERPSSLK